MNLRDFLKPFFVFIGSILVIVGLVTLPLPIPIGALFLIVGLLILLSSSYTAVLLLRRIREDYPKLDKWLEHIEEKSPDFVQKVLRRSDPN